MMNYYYCLKTCPGTAFGKTWRTTLALMAIFVMFGIQSIKAQVDVSSTGGPLGATSFTTLKAAFDNINSGSFTGAITIGISGDTSETVTAVLNASGSGSASYTSVLISPTGGVAHTISGAMAAGSSLIQLNGADNVTIDGLNTGGNALTLSNTTVSSTAGTSTIKFMADATGNTITNCSILGSGTTASATDGGNIWFSTGTTTGNDNNTISNNNIGPAGSNLPSKLIYSIGSTTNSTIYNSGITVTGNNLYDYFLATGDCHGMYVQTGSSDWTITNNKFYQTASRTFTTAGSRMYGINFNYSNANNVQITGNTFGYASSAGTGTLTVLGNGGITGIYFLASSTAANTCNVNNNIISDISFTTTNKDFLAINNGTGSSSSTLNFNGNIIRNISLVSSTGSFYGISWASGTNISISNNQVFNITRNAAGSIYGLYSASSSTNETVNNNQVHDLSCTTGAGGLYGIYQNTTSGTKSFQGNQIYNFSSTAAGTIYGIYANQGTTQDVSGNTIHTLSVAGNGTIYGIYRGGTATTSNIHNNKIYDISGNGAGTGVTVYGFYSGGGANTNVSNNLIGDIRATATAATNGVDGIYLSGGTTANVSYNTVYLSGTSSGANFGSSAMYANTGVNLTMKDNIFVNATTPTGTGLAAAYRRSDTTLASYNAASNNNMFFGSTIYTDGTNTDATLAAFKTRMATRDQQSVSENPTFLSTSGSSSNFLHLDPSVPTLAESGGSPVAGITTDFDGNTRNASTPDIGAGEFTGTTPAPVVSITSVTPSGSQCTATARMVVATATTSMGTITGVMLNYSFNGTAQTPIVMTNTGGNDWSGTIPAGTPSNAVVAWSVTATNSGSVTASANGSGYADDPNVGILATAAATLTSVCSGSPTVLSATLAPSTFPYTEGFESGIAGFTGANVAGTVSLTQNSTYASAGSKSMYLNTASTSADVSASSAANINLSGLPKAYLTFSHIAAMESPTTSFDYGYVQYSSDGGTTWTSFPTSSYLGAGSIFNGVVSFSTKSYSDWIAAFTSTSSIPTNALWKTETLSIPTAALTSQFRIRFRYTTDSSTNYYGWLIDNVKISTANPGVPTAYSWSDGAATVGTGNNLSVSPTSTTTYTATVTVNGCTITSSPVTVTTLALPTAPTATDSSQCGNAVPTASVADPNGFTTPTFNWYAASSGGTALQSSTATTYATSISATTTFYVSVVNPATGCESARTPVTVTVTIPDAISATPSSSGICLGQSVTLTGANTASTPTQNYTYTWSSTAGSGAESPVTGNPIIITPTAVGTYTYNVTATDGGCTTNTTTTVTVSSVPTILATASNGTICEGNSTALSAVVGGVGLASSIGTGTSTTGATSQPTAFCNRWPNYASQTIYTAAELQAAGLTAGNITSMAYNITTLGDGATNANFTVKIGTTANSTFPSTTFLSTTGYTTVYGPATYTHTASGLQTINFTTPFAWDGTSNIVVSVTMDGADSINNSQTFYTTATDKTLWVNSYSGSPTTGSLSPNRLNVIFGGIVGTTSGYTFTWNPGNLSGATQTVSPSATTTYTVTAANTTSGCSNTQNVTVTVNPQPIAPVASNSTQCGAGVPSASVSDPNGFTTPTFVWYSAASGGTALQTSTSTTYTTSVAATTTFYVSVINPTTSCESLRTPVTVTFTAADPITITPSTTTPCEDTAFTLGASSANAGYVYTWTASPVAGSGIPTSMTGASINVTPTDRGTYVYTVSGTDGNCTATQTVSIDVAAPIVNASASLSTVCSGSPTVLTATTIGIGPGLSSSIGTGTSQTGATAQPTAFCNRWPNYKSQTIYTAAELSAAGLVAGNITSIAYNISTLGDGATNDNFTVKIGTMASATFPNTTFVDTSAYTTVFGPATYTHTASGLQTVTFSTPFVWDGTSNIMIEVTMDGADSINNSQTFYTTATDKTLWVNSFTGSTTTGTLSANRLNLIFGGQAQTSMAGSLVYTWNPGNLTGNSVTVSPTATTTYTVSAFDPSSGCTATKDVTVTVNAIPTAPVASDATQCGAGIPTASVSDPNGYTSPTFTWYDAAANGNVLQASTANTYGTSISATTTFYVSVTNPVSGCESPRTPVTVTYTSPAAITFSPGATVSGCANEPLAMSVSSSNASYVYTWTASPAAGSGITGSVTGASPSITPTAAGTYVYTVSASDGTCNITGTITATVSQSPSALSIVQSGNNCLGQVLTLTANGGTINGAVLMNESFDSGFGSFAVTAASTVSSTDFTPEPNGYEYSGSADATFSGSTNGFVLANADTGASGMSWNTAVTSPSFSTMGATGLSLNFKEFLNNPTSTDAAVEISTDDFATSTVLRNDITNDIGSDTAFANTTLAIPAAFENQPNVKVRFRLAGGWDWWWALDEVSVTGTVAATTVWSPTTELYTDASATIPYSGESTAVVYAKATTSHVYTATATVGSCSVSTTTTVSPTALPTFTLADATICNGGSTTLTATGAGNIYSWSPATGLSATTGSSVTANPTVTTTYTVTATSNSSGCQSQQTVTVTVNDPPAFTDVNGFGISPLNPTSIDGQTVVFTTSASGTGLTYQWFVSTDGGSTFSPVGGETASTLSITVDPGMSGYQYHVVVSGAAPCTSLTSQNATLNVDNTGITGQPQSVTVCAGNAAQFTVTASSENPEDVITYSWEVSTDNGVSFIPVADGADATITGYTFSGSDTNTLQLASADVAANEWVFHAIVNGYIGSDNATLTVKTPPSITTDIQTDVFACANSGTAAVFSVAAAGDNLTYQWQVSTDNGITWANVSNGSGVTGATTNTLSLTNLSPSADNNVYQVIVGGAAQCTSVTSAIGKLHVNNVAITTPPANMTVAAGSAGTFTVVASGTGLSYQWQYFDGSTWSNVADGTPASYTYTASGASLAVNVPASATGTAQYRVTVSAGSCSATSAAATLTVAAYCTTGLTTSGGVSDSIANVVLTNTTTSANVTQASSGASPWYTLYSSPTLAVTQGQTVSAAITFGTDGTQHSAIWVDYNHNGTYEASENVALSTAPAGSSSTVTYSFTVPFSALTGPTRIRIRGAGDNAYTAAGACTPQSWGETEEYVLDISQAPACSGTPVAGTVTSSGDICSSGTATLTASGYTSGVTGISFQWYNTVSGLIAGATSSTYTTPTINSSNSYYVRVTCAGSGLFADSNTVTVNVTAPAITSTTPNSRCGQGTVVLAAAAASGNIAWYGAATGGNALFVGNNFTTPVINATTTYYVENNIGGESGQAGATGPATSTNGTSTGSHGILFTTSVPNVTINSVAIPFTGIGTFTIALKDGSASTTITSVTTSSVTGSGLTPVSVPLNLKISTPGNYALIVTGVSGTVGNLGYGSTTYPSTGLSGGFSVTSGYWFGADSSTNMYLFNLAVSTGCGSTRVPVTATVNTPPALTLSSAAGSACVGSSSANVTITAGLADYDTFVWSPSTGVSGSAATGYTFSAPASTVYTLTASSSTSGCGNSATFALTVNPLPANVAVSPATAAACSASTTGVQLTATGGLAAVYGNTMNVLPSDFAVVNTSGTGSAVLNTDYHSEGTGSVRFNTTNVSANVSYAMNANVNLAGAAAAQLTFDHQAVMESPTTSFDYGYVEYSTNGGSTWTTFPSSAYAGTGTVFSSLVKFSTLSYSDWVSAFTSSSSLPNNALWKSETINIPAGALTSQFRIRFRYTTDSSTNYYGWMIDNVKIKTDAAANVTWTPTTGLYTDASASTPYTGTATRTVYAKPGATTVYTASVTDPATTCSATASATINVVQTPTVVAPDNQSYCAGSLTSAISLTSTPPTGVSYTISGGAAVGLPNLSGVTSIPAFTAVAGTATVSITPTGNGCTGIPVTYNITVSPQTVAGTVAGGGNTVCTGADSGLLSLTGNTGDVVRWESAVAPFSVWTPINVTTATYTSGPLTQTTQFRAVVKSGSCVEMASNAVTVTVNQVTLSSVTSAEVCANTDATVTLNGLVPNSTSTIAYTKSGVAQTPVTVTADATGTGTFNVMVTASGQNVVITQITRTDVTPSCPISPTSNNSVTFVLSTGCSNLGVQCGVTLPTIDTYVYSTIVANTQAYRWRVTNLTGPNVGQVQTFDTSVRSLKLIQLSSYAFATQYKIEVATKRSNAWGPYGTACTVTTPSPTTALGPCGQTLTTISDNLYANIVNYAAGYMFRVTDPVSPTNTQEIIRPIRDFKLTMVTAFPVSYNKTYNVEVAVKNTDGTYLPYGSVCTVTTPAFPTTSVQDSQCDGFVVPTANTQIYAISYPGAIKYAFHFSGGNLGTTGVEIVNTVRSFTVAQIPGWAPAQTYDVKVRLIFNETDPAGPYGKTCTIVTPGLSRPVASEEAPTSFDAIAYPNPFAETFDIKVTTADKDNVSVMVYDMAGRLLETRTVKVTQVESLHIGDRYPSGVYNVIVTQGDNVKTLRVIKR